MSALGFFNKTEKQALLDSLNESNKTYFTFDQVSFSDPVTVDNKTYVTVSPTTGPTTENSVNFYYKKFDLYEFFLNYPVVLNLDTITKTSVINALKEQRQIYFTEKDIELTLLPNTLLTDVSIPWTETTASVRLTALNTNYIWSGSFTIYLKKLNSLLGKSIKQDVELGKYFTQYPLENKYPVEIAYKQKVILDDFYLTFNKYKVNDVIALDNSILSALNKVTGDVWVSSTQSIDFNIKGAIVRYRGPNTGTWFTGTKQASHVFVLELSPLCSNLKGLIKIQYTDPNVHRFLNFNVDNGPILDLL